MVFKDVPVIIVGSIEVSVWRSKVEGVEESPVEM